MNRVTTHNGHATGNPQPLFASSWVALYVILRENLTRGGAWNASAQDSPKTGSVGYPH